MKIKKCINMFKRFLSYWKYLRIVKRYKGNFNRKQFQVGIWGKIGKKITVPLDKKTNSEELSFDPYLVLSSDVDILAQKYIDDEIETLHKILNNLSISNYVKQYSISKVGKFDYIIEYGSKDLNTDKFARNLLYTLVTVISLFTAYSLVGFITKVGIMGIIGFFSPQVWVVIIIGLLLFISNFFRKSNKQS
jgi:hypothetical protein